MYGLSKKKMPYLHLIDEAIGLLNTEIRLIEWRIKYPEQLQQRINKQPLSPLYLADKTTLINLNGLANLIKNEHDKKGYR